MKYLFLILLLITCQSLFAQLWIQPGATLTADSTVHITLEDMDLQADGVLTPAQSTLHLQGNAVSTLRSVADTIALHHLYINKSGSYAMIDTHMRATGSVYMQQGNLDLSGHSLNLLNRGHLENEAESRRIYSSQNGGQILREVVYTEPLLADSGNLGLRISAPMDTFGATLLIRGHDIQAIGLNNSIRRYYTFIPTYAAGGPPNTVDVEFSYWDAELNLTPESDLALFMGNAGGGNWNSMGYSSQDSSGNVVGFSFTAGLGPARFTLSSSNVLPVSWLGFTARPDGGQVFCEWQTAHEINSGYFILERSPDGRTFEALSQIKAAGHSNTIQTYQQLDSSPQMGRNFYRVKQVDLDGTISYSHMEEVTFSPSLSCMLSPNPAKAHTTLSMHLTERGTVSLQMLDMRGRQVQSQQLHLSQGHHTIPVDVQPLTEGIYTLMVGTPKQQWALKLWVE